jgi:hypothetical protein
MKRTTIRLDDQLLAEVKALAARNGTTFTSVVHDALRERLARDRQARPRKRVRLPVFTGRGLQEGVDLDDSAALLELMEGGSGAP